MSETVVARKWAFDWVAQQTRSTTLAASLLGLCFAGVAANSQRISAILDGNSIGICCFVTVRFESISLIAGSTTQLISVDRLG
jgi:hypothetical protein